MPQTGYTPIQIYSSSTPTNAPSAGNLTNDTKGSELAINIADKNLFFKDSSNVVNTVPIRQSGTSSNGWLSSTDWNTFNNKQPAGAYLTSVTADAPLSGAGTSASHLVIAQATTSTSGYLSSTDWNTFNNKQPAGTYVTSVSGTAPVVSSGGTTPAISMAAATTSVNGYLTSTDWNTFNGKQTALVSGSNIKTVSGTTLLGSGDLGTIGTGYGGTGLTSFTANGVLYASSTSALATSGSFTFNGSQVAINTTTLDSGKLTINTGAQYGIDLYRSDLAANYAAIRFRNTTNSGTYGSLGFDSGGLRVNGDAGIIYFTTSGADVARMYSSGGVSIGNTTDPGAGVLSVSTATWSGPPSSPNIWTPVLAVGNSTNWIQAYQTGFYFNTAFYVVNTTPVGVYMNSGATAWSAYSDARLKTVTGVYQNALDDIDVLEPVKFVWNWDKDKKPCVGLNAASVEKVVPEAIDYSKLQNTEDETEYMTVRYTEVIPLLVASIQELKAKLKSAGVAGF